jgi:Raf kinase inhibitor-like YbhB/YbcL family protein
MTKMILIIVILLMVCFCFSCASYNIDLSEAESLTVTSPAFSEGGIIPVKHTRRGEDISPELHLSKLSPDAKSIAIIMEDLDWPPIRGGFSHWVIWNIPVQEIIPERIPQAERVETLGGAVQGNAFGKHYYGGPQPPRGASHRYRFNMYVLDTVLAISPDSDKTALLKNMDGHILQYGFLTGQYE